jgi:hypothetical protein
VGIYVLSDTSILLDTDEFDDDVLWHEVGHFMADQFSKDESPGGVHYLSENDYDLRLTWSEGWGNFFPSSIKSTISPSLLSTAGQQASVYVDTFVGDPPDPPLSIDIAAPDDSAKSFYCFGQCKYSSNEIAVANVLWNLFAGTGGFGMQPIWDVIDVFDQGLPRISSPINLETFWNEWLFQRAIPAELPTLISIYRNRSIDYALDSWEPNADFSSASAYTFNTSQYHTLYSDPTTTDYDFISFNVTSGQTYTITTDTILNGADTVIVVYAPDQTTVLAQNDNTSGLTYVAPFNCDFLFGDCHENGDDLLGTRAVLSSATTISYGNGNYYVQIYSTPYASNKPQSAGRYGSYQLTITTP